MVVLLRDNLKEKKRHNIQRFVTLISLRNFVHKFVHDHFSQYGPKKLQDRLKNKVRYVFTWMGHMYFSNMENIYLKSKYR